MGSKIDQIIEGWRNTIVPPEDLVVVIDTAHKHRIEICEKCKHHSDNDPKSSPLRPDVYCTKCGCTLKAKTKCLSCKCPLSPPLWEEINIKTE